MPPSIIAVILSCLGLSKQLGRVGRFAIGPGGPLVRGGGALVLAPFRPLGVALRIVGHSGEPTSVFRLSERGMTWQPGSCGRGSRGYVTANARCANGNVSSPGRGAGARLTDLSISGLNRTAVRFSN